MRCSFYARLPVSAALAALVALISARAAIADQVIQTPQAPVVVIHSAAGLVTVTRGDDGAVRVAGGQSPNATTFQITESNQGMLLPRGLGFPSRRFNLPGVQAGTTGVRVDNPGGDMTVYVPQRVAAVLVKLDDGDAALTQFRGPYVVVTNGGSVDLQGLAGFGHIRTTTGRVTVKHVGGNLRIETTSGSVMATQMLAERAEIKTQAGDIDWNFAHLAGGPYHFTSEAGNVRVALADGMPASIDAQSSRGSVISRFRRSDVRYRSQHAMSMSLGGGGAEITASSGSGIVEIGPRRR